MAPTRSNLLAYGLLLMAMLGMACQPASPLTPRAEDTEPQESPSSPVAEPTSTSEPVLPSPGDVQMTPSPSIPSDAGLQNLIDQAIADLSQRLSIPASQIAMVEASPVTWPDSSLGCPQPGMSYLQVSQDGLLIRLQVGDRIYSYHSGGVRKPFLCEKTGKDPSPPAQIDLSHLTPLDEDQ